MTTAYRAVGVLLLVAGLGLGSLFAWSAVITPAVADQTQQQVTDTLLQQWTTGTAPAGAAAVGAPIARLTISRLGKTWTVVEGVGLDQLAEGPGHYPGTANPGEVGNFAVAGHRTGSMDVFRDLDELKPCDPLTVETAAGAFTYRVLADQPTASCPISVHGVPGVQIVGPDRGDLVLPLPGQPKARPTRALLTLTTCHPLGSNVQRLVIHAVLVSP